jgi:hypothetical protein
MCAWSCTRDEECPKGYFCVSKSTVGSGKKNVCYPNYATISNILLIQASTCQGLKDVFKFGCNNQQDTCGLPNVKDSVCIETQYNNFNISVCEIPCNVDRDCPDAMIYGVPVPTKCTEVPNMPFVKLCFPSKEN